MPQKPAASIHPVNDRLRMSRRLMRKPPFILETKLSTSFLQLKLQIVYFHPFQDMVQWPRIMLSHFFKVTKSLRIYSILDGWRPDNIVQVLVSCSFSVLTKSCCVIDLLSFGLKTAGHIVSKRSYSTVNLPNDSF